MAGGKIDEQDRYHVSPLCLDFFCERCTDARWCLCKCHRPAGRPVNQACG